MKRYGRDEAIDKTLDVFKAYPPNGRHKHTFGRYEMKDGHGRLGAVMWVDLTEFRKSKGNESIKTYTVDGGSLVFVSYMSKRWLSKFAGVC